MAADKRRHGSGESQPATASGPEHMEPGHAVAAGDGGDAGRGSKDAAEEEVSDARWRTAFEIGIGRRYHAKRREAFRLLDQASKLISISSGSAIAVQAVSSDPTFLLTLGIIVMVAGISPIVLRWGDRATEHRLLVWRYTDLSKALDEAKTMAGVRSINREIKAIEQDEEEPLKALLRICDIEQSTRSRVAAHEMEQRPWLLNRLLAPWVDLPFGLPPPRTH